MVFIFFHPDDRVPNVDEVLEQKPFRDVVCTDLEGFHPVRVTRA
jgi:hypothetical protein